MQFHQRFSLGRAQLLVPLKKPRKDGLLGIPRSRGGGLACEWRARDGGERYNLNTWEAENQELKASLGYTAGPVKKEKPSQAGEWRGGAKRGKDGTQVHRQVTQVTELVPGAHICHWVPRTFGRFFDLHPRAF